MGTGDPVLDDILAEAAARFESRLPQLALENASIQRLELPSVQDIDAPELWDVNHRITRDSRRVQAQHLLHGRRLPETCPEPDLEAARFAFHSGIPISDTLKAYRIGHEVTSRTWREVIAGMDLPDRERAECVRAISEFVDAYDRRIADLVADEYERERNRGRGAEDSYRYQAVLHVVEGRRDALPGLDYALGASHVGVIASGPDSEASIRDLAREVGARLLHIRVEDELHEGWLGLMSPWSEQRRRTIAQFLPRARSALAVGMPHQGLDGFRRTHREAGAAHLVAKRMQRSVTLYENVALEALALRDERAAREFVNSELAALSGQGRDDGKQVDTLQAYFAAGHNKTAAAAALGVSEVTVKRRIRAIEDRIGRPVEQRRAELELALRLSQLLPDVAPHPLRRASDRTPS